MPITADDEKPVDWEEIEKAFETIGPDIEQFAQKNRLALHRYYHDTATWDLPFRRKEQRAIGSGHPCRF